MISLWAISVYLIRNGRNYILTMLPAMFMTAVTVTYFIVSPECLGLLWGAVKVDYSVFYPIGVTVGIIMSVVFVSIFLSKEKFKKVKLK